MKVNAIKALILCNDFPPVNTIGADRPYAWFKYFKDFGIEPTVITKSTGNQIEIEETESGKIIRVPAANSPAITFQKKFGSRFGFIRKALTYSESYFSLISNSFDRHNSIYYEAKKFLTNNHADIIITTAEPYILFKYGKQLKKIYKSYNNK